MPVPDVPDVLDSSPAKHRRVQRAAFALLPLLGVFLLGWDARGVVSYYCAANLAILLTQPAFIILGSRRRGDAPLLPSLNGASLLPPPNGAPIDVGAVPPPPKPRPNRSLVIMPMTPGKVVFVIGFFCFHFGMFTLVHLLFLTIFGMVDVAVLPTAVLIQTVRRVVVDGRREVELGAIAPYPAHVYSNIIVLHMTILLGVWVSLFFGGRTSLAAALLLCVFGALAELGRGRRGRRRQHARTARTTD